MSDTNVGSMFWDAAQKSPSTTVEAPKQSSCCGPKPSADKAEHVEKAGQAGQAEAPKQSSCCGPKPTTEQTETKKSCCGHKHAVAATEKSDAPAAEVAEKSDAPAAQPVKKSCCG
ncbi:hypothetical protein [Streptomyces sp. NPDC058463]|uniref:hypothetical protein n=1 Tax=Streptomyces sp. NPDC058463 TaxID=3346510 RepID=UPI003660A5C6